MPWRSLAMVCMLLAGCALVGYHDVVSGQRLEIYIGATESVDFHGKGATKYDVQRLGNGTVDMAIVRQQDKAAFASGAEVESWERHDGLTEAAGQVDLPEGDYSLAFRCHADGEGCRVLVRTLSTHD